MIPKYIALFIRMQSNISTKKKRKSKLTILSFIFMTCR